MKTIRKTHLRKTKRGKCLVHQHRMKTRRSAGKIHELHMRCPECGKILTNEKDCYGHDCEAPVKTKRGMAKISHPNKQIWILKPENEDEKEIVLLQNKRFKEIQLMERLGFNEELDTTTGLVHDEAGRIVPSSEILNRKKRSCVKTKRGAVKSDLSEKNEEYCKKHKIYHSHWSPCPDCENDALCAAEKKMEAATTGEITRFKRGAVKPVVFYDEREKKNKLALVNEKDKIIRERSMTNKEQKEYSKGEDYFNY